MKHEEFLAKYNGTDVPFKSYYKGCALFETDELDDGNKIALGIGRPSMEDAYYLSFDNTITINPSIQDAVRSIVLHDSDGNVLYQWEKTEW